LWISARVQRAIARQASCRHVKRHRPRAFDASRRSAATSRLNLSAGTPVSRATRRARRTLRDAGKRFGSPLVSRVQDSSLFRYL
jgi:hypothetical protein